MLFIQARPVFAVCRGWAAVVSPLSNFSLQEELRSEDVVSPRILKKKKQKDVCGCVVTVFYQHTHAHQHRINYTAVTKFQ